MMSLIYRIVNFPGGPVVKNRTVNAGDMSLIHNSHAIGHHVP